MAPTKLVVGSYVNSVLARHCEPSGEAVFFIEDGDCFGIRPREVFIVLNGRMTIEFRDGKGELKQGEIGVESEGVPGRGSRFWFTLPVAPPGSSSPDD